MQRLWYVNSDFEAELADRAAPPHANPRVEKINREISYHLLKLAQPGDGLLISFSATERLRAEAARRSVEIVPLMEAKLQAHRTFTPWGWTLQAMAIGEKVGAHLHPIPVQTATRVNSKLFSHQLEGEFNIRLPEAFLASSMEDIVSKLPCVSPNEHDKWVIKSHLGFAARERVLGRGPQLDSAAGAWCRKRLSAGETLLIEPWLDVIREYGVQMCIAENGSCEIIGFSDQQTNGAGTMTGFLLGRPPSPERRRQLEDIAEKTAHRLFCEGYVGPVGMDALEHRNGLRPLLEINARYTVGILAVAAEKECAANKLPCLWTLRDGCGNFAQ